MCFSPEASFAASAALATVGLASVSSAKTKELRWVACIPLAFSVQQAIEGFQWLAPKPSELSLVLGYGFLFFAFLVWLIAVPVLAGLVEPQKIRKRLMRYLFYLGAAGAAYLLWFVATEPLTVCVVNHSIDYQIFLPYSNYFFVVYVLATCGSLLLSSQKHIRLFGWLTFFSLLVAFWVYRETLTSVWCFFAAILSCLVFLEVSRDPKLKVFFSTSQKFKGRGFKKNK